MLLLRLGKLNWMNRRSWVGTIRVQLIAFSFDAPILLAPLEACNFDSRSFTHKQHFPLQQHFFVVFYMGQLRPLFRLFLVLSNKQYNFTTNKCEKWHSGIWQPDLNSQPSNFKSLLLTTKPWHPLDCNIIVFEYVKLVILGLFLIIFVHFKQHCLCHFSSNLQYKYILALKCHCFAFLWRYGQKNKLYSIVLF